jgi:hypothetical protein
MLKIFIVTIDLNRGEEITKEELRATVQTDLYDSVVTVRELE